MEEKDKYFTPDIEDIRVGYECNIQLIENAQWTNFIVGKSNFEEIDAYEYLELGNLRTPYLTKEQIEAEGWETINDFSNGVVDFQKVGDRDYRRTSLNWNYVQKKIIINNNVTTERWGNHIYIGECKDINTFRYITKLLNIN